MDQASSLYRLCSLSKAVWLAGMLLASSTFAQTPPPAGLRLYLPLDETSGLTAADASPAKLAGTLAGFTGDAQWVAGKKSNSLTFSGAQYVAVAGLPSINSTTWACWVNATATPNNSGVISAKFTGATAGHSLGFGSAADALKPRIVWNHNLAATILLSPTALALNEWHHIALTYDNATTTLRLYVDGEQKAVSTTAATTAFSTINLGRREASSAQPFTGLVDEVVVYDRALDIGEIKTLAGKVVSGPPVISSPPAGRTVSEGTRVEFAVQAEGATPFTYEWRKNGTAISGATNSTFVLEEALAADSGAYSVHIINSVGNATSTPVTLTVNPINLNDGLQAHWKLDETTGFVVNDSTANANHGALPSDIFATDNSQWVAGQIGGGLMFNGANFFEAPDSPSIGADLVNGFTVATWFRSNADLPATGGNRVPRMLEKDNSYFFLMNPGTGGMNFLVKRGAANYTANVVDSILANRWYHLAGTFDGQTVRVYLDGVLKGETVVGGPIDNGANNVPGPLRVGSDYPTGTAFFNGVVDNLQIWKRPLNARELRNVMGRDLAEPPGFKTQPQSQTRFAGATATFSVDVKGKEPFRFLWLKGTQEIRGATESTLAITNLTPADAGEYKVKVTNPLGEVFSQSATLSVTPVAGLNTGLAAYWKFDETTGLVAGDSSSTNAPVNLIDFADNTSHWVAGQVNRALQFDGAANRATVPNSANFQVDREGTFAFWIKPATYGTSLSAGTYNYSEGRVLRKPGHFDIFITDNPGGVRRTIIANGANAPQTILDLGVWQHFTVVFKAGTVQFYKNGFPAGGPKTASLGAVGTSDIALAFDDLTATPRFFNGAMDELRIWNRPLTESEILQIAGKDVAGVPVIEVPPQPARRLEGNTATFSVIATGARPVSYQWFHNNNAILSGTNSTLQISNLSLTNAGAYKVRVSNTLGAATSSEVTLIVEPLSSITSGLIAYWNFDETGGALLRDQSGRGHDGALQNFTAVPGMAGAVGGALDFDGVDDFITVPHSDGLNLIDQGTISVWVRPRALQVVGGLSRIVRKSVNYDLTITQDRSGTLRFYGINKAAYDAADAAVALNTWQHFAIVLKDGFIQYYKNGRALGSPLLGFLGEVNADPLIIGNFQPDLEINRILNGQMDELGIWSRALTPGDIDGIYQNGLLGKPLTTTFEPLTIKSITARTQAEITFATPYTGRTYLVESKRALTDSIWTAETGVQFASAGGSLMRATFALPANSPKFFRVVAQPVPPVYSENFDTGAAGWTHGGAEDNWELGTPTQGPMAAHSAPNVYATGLGSNYRAFTDSYLHSPVIDLRAVGRGTLTFWEWRNTDIDPTFHGAVVNILDASNMVVLEELARDAGPTGGWQQRSLRLGANSLGKRIILEFRLYSDQSNLREGWFLDDLAISPE